MGGPSTSMGRMQRLRSPCHALSSTGARGDGPASAILPTAPRARLRSILPRASPPRCGRRSRTGSWRSGRATSRTCAACSGRGPWPEGWLSRRRSQEADARRFGSWNPRRPPGLWAVWWAPRVRAHFLAAASSTADPGARSRPEAFAPGEGRPSPRRWSRQVTRCSHSFGGSRAGTGGRPEDGARCLKDSDRKPGRDFTFRTRPRCRPARQEFWARTLWSTLRDPLEIRMGSSPFCCPGTQAISGSRVSRPPFPLVPVEPDGWTAVRHGRVHPGPKDATSRGMEAPSSACPARLGPGRTAFDRHVAECCQSIERDREREEAS